MAAVTAPGKQLTPLPVPRRLLVAEIWLVFALSLGASGGRALLDLISDLNSGVPLSKQAAALNVSQNGLVILGIFNHLPQLACRHSVR